MIQLEIEQLVAAFDALDSGVVVLDRDQRVVCWNYWFASASGISSRRRIRKDIRRAISGTSSRSSDDIDLRRAFLGFICLPNLYAQPESAAASNESRLALDSQRFGPSVRGSDPTRTAFSKFPMSPAPRIAIAFFASARTRATTPSSKAHLTPF